MRADERNSHCFAWRASRRRNCLTETTRTRFRRAILIKSRSRLRSSSLVTKYCALPPIAASTIWSSSGSRQIFSSPDVCTTVARAAINRTNASASRWAYRNRRTNRGLLRTSAISLSCESDVTTLNSSSAQAATTCPGGPFGLRKAETQTLVSSRTTSGTAYCFCLGAGLCDFRLDFFLRYAARAPAHLAHQPVKVSVPPTFAAQGNGHSGFFSQAQRFERSKHAVFENCLESFVDQSLSLSNCHDKDYIGDPMLRSIEPEAICLDPN
jgi:hypothetical protein